MRATDIVPVSVLRMHTNKVFQNLETPKCIIANNEAKGFLMSVKDYEKIAEFLEPRNTVVDFGKQWVDAKKLLTVHKKKK